MAYKAKDVAPRDWVSVTHESTMSNTDSLEFYVETVGNNSLTSAHGIKIDLREWKIETLYPCSTNPTAPGYYRLDYTVSDGRERTRMYWLQSSGEWKYYYDNGWRNLSERSLAAARGGADGVVTGFDYIGFSQQPALTFTELKDA